MHVEQKLFMKETVQEDNTIKKLTSNEMQPVIDILGKRRIGILNWVHGK
jgi:hypothetical protein